MENQEKLEENAGSQTSKEPIPNHESIETIREHLKGPQYDEEPENDEHTHGSNEEMNGIHDENKNEQFEIERLSWNCPYCPYIAKKNDFIQVHIRENHATVTCYKCTQCDFSNSQMSSLTDHVRRKHEKIKYPCPECKYKFTTTWNREGHILTRHPKKAEKILEFLVIHEKPNEYKKSCPFCDFGTMTSISLKKHFEEDHQDLIRFKCLYCVYRHENYDRIADHMKEIHADDVQKMES